MEKYNFKTKKYESYSIPKEWKTPLVCNDMNEIINCANCGRKVKYGSTYTSLKIHANVGMGYPVCQYCYKKEWKEREMWKND